MAMKLKSLLVVLIALPTFLFAQNGKVSTIMSAGENELKSRYKADYIWQMIIIT